MEEGHVGAARRAVGVDVGHVLRANEVVVARELGLVGPGLEGVLGVGIAVKQGHVDVAGRAVDVHVAERGHLVFVAVAGERAAVGVAGEGVLAVGVVAEEGHVDAAAAVDGDRLDARDREAVAVAGERAAAGREVEDVVGGGAGDGDGVVAARVRRCVRLVTSGATYMLTPFLSTVHCARSVDGRPRTCRPRRCLGR